MELNTKKFGFVSLCKLFFAIKYNHSGYVVADSYTALRAWIRIGLPQVVQLSIFFVSNCIRSWYVVEQNIYIDLKKEFDEFKLLATEKFQIQIWKVQI